MRDNFYWITNNSGYIRQDLVIYTYPYTDPNTFTYEYLTAKRDSVMRANIPGEVEGSYMGTEWKYARPEMQEITVNGEYAAEIRGLWKMIGGGSMGGPYYSLTRLDEVNQRVVTIEGFVFAPATNKRNAPAAGRERHRRSDRDRRRGIGTPQGARTQRIFQQPRSA